MSTRQQKNYVQSCSSITDAQEGSDSDDSVLHGGRARKSYFHELCSSTDSENESSSQDEILGENETSGAENNLGKEKVVDTAIVENDDFNTSDLEQFVCQILTPNNESKNQDSSLSSSRSYIGFLNLVSCNRQCFDPQNELRRVFGRELSSFRSSARNAPAQSNRRQENRGDLTRRFWLDQSLSQQVRNPNNHGLHMTVSDGCFEILGTRRYESISSSVAKSVREMRLGRQPQQPLQTIIQNYPFHLEANLRMAEVFISQGDMDACVPFLSRALLGLQLSFHPRFNPFYLDSCRGRRQEGMMPTIVTLNNKLAPPIDDKSQIIDAPENELETITRDAEIEIPKSQKSSLKDIYIFPFVTESVCSNALVVRYDFNCLPHQDPILRLQPLPNSMESQSLQPLPNLMENINNEADDSVGIIHDKSQNDMCIAHRNCQYCLSISKSTPNLLDPQQNAFSDDSNNQNSHNINSNTSECRPINSQNSDGQNVDNQNLDERRINKPLPSTDVLPLENPNHTSVFRLLIYHIRVLDQRGHFRVALECSKLMLTMGLDRDVANILLSIDYFILQSRLIPYLHTFSYHMLHEILIAFYGVHKLRPFKDNDTQKIDSDNVNNHDNIQKFPKNDEMYNPVLGKDSIFWDFQCTCPRIGICSGGKDIPTEPCHLLLLTSLHFLLPNFSFSFALSHFQSSNSFLPKLKDIVIREICSWDHEPHLILSSISPSSHLLSLCPGHSKYPNQDNLSTQPHTHPVDISPTETLEFGNFRRDLALMRSMILFPEMLSDLLFRLRITGDQLVEESLYPHFKWKDILFQFPFVNFEESFGFSTMYRQTYSSICAIYAQKSSSLWASKQSVLWLHSAAGHLIELCRNSSEARDIISNYRRSWSRSTGTIDIVSLYFNKDAFFERSMIRQLSHPPIPKYLLKQHKIDRRVVEADSSSEVDRYNDMNDISQDIMRRLHQNQTKVGSVSLFSDAIIVFFQLLLPWNTIDKEGLFSVPINLRITSNLVDAFKYIFGKFKRFFRFF